MEAYKVITQSSVNVFVSSTVTTFIAEKRFPKNLSIGELKVKIPKSLFYLIYSIHMYTFILIGF